MIDQKKFREELVTKGNQKNFMANMILDLLKDTDSDFEQYTLEDFLNDRKLFKQAKESVYDMLPKKDQRILNVTDRILWGNDREEKQNENTKVYQEAFEGMKTDEMFLSLKKLFNGEENMKNLFIWELIVSELEKIEEFKSKDFRENITIDYIKKLDPYHKSLFIFKILKIFLGGIGFPFLPEKWKDDRFGDMDDRASANMNNFAVITGIPFTEDWTRFLRKESMELMVRLNDEHVKTFFYHFEINTPDKLNEIAKKFVGTEFSKKLDEAGIHYEHPIRNDDNYLVKFLYDSFGGAKGMGFYLEAFKINTIEELEKLFPYGVIHGRMHTWHSKLGLEKAFKLYSLLGIESVDDLVGIFGNEKFDSLLESLEKVKIGRLKKLFVYLGFEESYLRFNFIMHENFSKIADKKFKETEEIGNMIGASEQADRVKYIYHENTPKIHSLGAKKLKDVFDFMEIKTPEESREFVYEKGFKKFAKNYKKHGEVFNDDTYSFDSGDSKKTYVNESLDLLSLVDKGNIQVFPEDETVSEANWMKALIGYGASTNPEVFVGGKISETYRNLFEELEAQNLVYDGLYTIYLKLINQEKINHKELAVLNALGEYGVGNLSYTTLLVRIANYVRQLPGKTHENIIEEIQNNLLDIENVSKNWSLMERTNLYGNITSLMTTNLNVARNCLSIINALSNNLSKKFGQEVLPIIVSWSYLIGGGYGYNSEDSKELNEYISSILQKAHNGEFDNQQQEILKTDILKSMRKWIQQRFHIKEMPLESLIENMGTIQNYLTYLANIQEKTEQKTAILGLYLGLQLNNKRNDFRTGKEIKYEEIFNEDITRTLENYFQERKEIDLFTGYSDAQKKIFQTDTNIQTIGTVKTIDSKLSAIDESTNDLLDEDNFTTEDEKHMLGVLLKHEKVVGGTLVLIFQGKENLFKDNHVQAKEELEKYFGELNKSNISPLQMLLNKVSPTVNFANKIKEIDIKKKVEKLNMLKLPNAELVKIFGKAGEKLSTSSGVIPIKNDIEYLSDILKKSSILSKKEKKTGFLFLSKVEQHLQLLEKDFTKIASIYKNLAKTILEGDNESLKGRIKDMNRLFDVSKQSGEQSFLTTKLTSNFDIIIPNIRGCLGCMKKEINNDTNLTFGDSNKFFAAVFAEDPNRSIADCIVDVFPYSLGEEYNEEEAKKIFIIERVYGERTPDVLLSIVNVILKKKQESNIDDIDILISDEAIMSCGLKENQLKEFLQNESLNIQKTSNAHVNVLKSASGNGYYEFARGGWGKYNGVVKATGILIKNIS